MCALHINNLCAISTQIDRENKNINAISTQIDRENKNINLTHRRVVVVMIYKIDNPHHQNQVH